MPQTRSLTALAKRCEPDPSYHPLNYMKYFPNDITQQDTLFGDDFEYDFSKWPHEFWLKPKHVTTNFQDVISKLKLATIIPPIIFANGDKRGWFDIHIRVHYANERNAAFQFYKCTVDYNDPHKIEHMLCHAIAFKLAKYAQLGTVHTIYKINIRGATSF